MSNVYTLKIGNKTISVNHKQRHYVIGFKNVVHARKVHYSMHPEPKFTLIRDNNIDLSKSLSEEGYDLTLSLDVNATLFIPKCKGSTLHPLNDAGVHMATSAEKEFLTYPVLKHIGVIMPYRLFDENDDEFIFTSYVIDPIIL